MSNTNKVKNNNKDNIICNNTNNTVSSIIIVNTNKSSNSSIDTIVYKYNQADAEWTVKTSKRNLSRFTNSEQNSSREQQLKSRKKIFTSEIRFEVLVVNEVTILISKRINSTSRSMILPEILTLTCRLINDCHRFS